MLINANIFVVKYVQFQNRWVWPKTLNIIEKFVQNKQNMGKDEQEYQMVLPFHFDNVALRFRAMFKSL